MMLFNVRTRSITFFLFVLYYLVQSPGYAQLQTEAVNAGTKITIHSSVLNEDRTFYISLPASYNLYPKAHYPVLYASDGPGFFPMISGQVNFLSDNFSIIPQMIVVCIDNPQRGRDLIPPFNPGSGSRPNDTARPGKQRMKGEGDRYLKMIKEDIIPYVESHYSTAPYRIFCGHSLGGLTAFNALLKFPEIFQAYIAISPSLQVGNGWAIRTADSVFQQGARFSKKLFYSDGNEGAGFHKNQLRMDSLLKEKRLTDFAYTYVHYENETHLSEPVKALYDGLRFLYPDWYPNLDMDKATAYRDIAAHYDALSKRYGYIIKPPEKYMDRYAHDLLAKPEKTDAAITIFVINAGNYPHSYSAYEGLGDAYKAKGDKVNGLVNYRKALILNPGNEELMEKIDALD